MENRHERKCVEVTFVSDQDVEREIISIKDRNKTKSGNRLLRFFYLHYCEDNICKYILIIF